MKVKETERRGRAKSEGEKRVTTAMAPALSQRRSTASFVHLASVSFLYYRQRENREKWRRRRRRRRRKKKKIKAEERSG